MAGAGDTAAPINLKRLLSKNPDIWRTTYRCGVNALYSYLLLLGTKVDYQELLDTLPIGQFGTPLAELQKAAERYGVQTMIVKATPGSLGELLPAIVHRDIEGNPTGHYDVILTIQPGWVTFIDGKGGGVAQLSTPEFYQSWTGYVLTQTGRTTRSRAVMHALLLAVAACVFGWLAFRVHRHMRRAGFRSKEESRAGSAPPGVGGPVSTDHPSGEG